MGAWELGVRLGSHTSIWGTWGPSLALGVCSKTAAGTLQRKGPGERAQGAH